LKVCWGWITLSACAAEIAANKPTIAMRALARFFMYCLQADLYRELAIYLIGLIRSVYPRPEIASYKHILCALATRQNVAGIF
jgi:hypothetical protein